MKSQQTREETAKESIHFIRTIDQVEWCLLTYSSLQQCIQLLLEFTSKIQTMQQQKIARPLTSLASIRAPTIAFPCSRDRATEKREEMEK